MDCCRSGFDHEALKRNDAAWALLDYVGLDPLGVEVGLPTLELRNCSCGSTIARPVDAAPGPSIETAARAVCGDAA
jgi:hypothetical protein